MVVHDHGFRADRLDIDVHIAPEEMFRLRIVRAAEYLVDKNLPSARGGKTQRRALNSNVSGKKPGNRGRSQKKLITF